MKYFTADLYERFNSRDIEVADRADTQWRKAEAKYQARLDKIRSRLPASIRDLADKLCLHDAEILSLGHDTDTASILARAENVLYCLSYALTSKVASTPPRRSPAFSNHAVRWLYDEVDMPAPSKFSHRILLSDGREISLFFAGFAYRAFEVHPLGTRSDLEPILRLAEALEKATGAHGAFRLNLSKAEAQKASAAATRVKARPNGHAAMTTGRRRVS
jgi:hypothetical protein